MTITTTALPMTGGVTASTGVGEDYLFTVAGTWTTGEKITLVFTDDASGVQTQVGAGNVTGVAPTFVFTYKNRVHILGGQNWYFSQLNSPTVFNDPNGVGNGFVTLTDFFAAGANAQSIANYQGKLAILGLDNIQIWQVDPDPTQFLQTQVMENIGTYAPEGVQALGDLDVLFPHYTGVRSLRVRDSSNNAFVVDIGSAIDTLIQAKLAVCTDTQKSESCAIIEPTSNRYWYFLYDTIFVLSYFPTNKIVAWSTYAATYNLAGVQTAFVPYKFVIYKGQVYCRDTGASYQYGGTDNQTYDACVGTWATSYLDLKQPGKMKESRSFGFACSGGWSVRVGADPKSSSLDIVYTNTGASFDIGSVTKSTYGSHYKFQGQTTGATAAVFSSLNMQYKESDKR